jgi:hypothetical protein
MGRRLSPARPPALAAIIEGRMAEAVDSWVEHSGRRICRTGATVTTGGTC